MKENVNIRLSNPLTIALAGNPNVGKSTIFNNLTGTRQHIGNYPGVTVEKKEGFCRHNGVDIVVVDLPGAYGLTTYSIEETVARNCILNEKPDVVAHVVDASNLERNLYLTVQLIELGAPLVLAFNMSDVVAARGETIDVAKLSILLGTPIVNTIGNRKQGMGEMLDAALARTRGTTFPSIKISYGREIDEELNNLEQLVAQKSLLAKTYPARWIALKLLEKDEDVRAKVDSPEILSAATASIRHLEGVFGEAAEIIIAERRYGFISGACQEAVNNTVATRHNMSDRIDAIVTSPLFGIPLLLLIMYLVFQLTFTAGAQPMAWLEDLFALFKNIVSQTLPDGRLRSLITDGVIGGMGGVLVFLPVIAILFAAIAVLEDSGYMARAAFIMDPLMHKIGLHGKSFIPMLLGFGCSVPAIMATRTLESRRDRLTTMLVVPLMSCSARLPVYTLLAGAFFSPRAAARVMFSIYLLGVILAVIMAKLFRRFLLPGTPTPFVIELPPYRLPTIRGVLIHVWERSWMYLKKAGTLILILSMAVWFLSTFPSDRKPDADYTARVAKASDIEQKTFENDLAQERLENSYAGRLGRVLAPALKPIGLGHWKIATALLAGLGGKEIVVSTLGTLYSLGETAEHSKMLRAALRQDPLFSPLTAYALMVFILIYIPCLPTIVMVRAETASWRWPLFHVLYSTLLAWIAAFVVYQLGTAFGIGAS